MRREMDIDSSTSGPAVTSGRRTRKAPAEYFGTAVVRANLQALLQLGPRTARNAGALDATLRFLESALASCGYDTQLVSFGEGPGDCNLLAHRAGTNPEAPLLEIGAHYDTVDDCPGADDNGSGVIGLLALARYFSQRQLQRSLRFCFFGAEETGLRVEPADMIGPVWRRDAVFDFNGAEIDSEEFFFVYRTSRFEPSTGGRTELENRYIHGHRWCGPADIAELAASGETVYPLQLRELLTEAAALASAPGQPRQLQSIH